MSPPSCSLFSSWKRRWCRDFPGSPPAGLRLSTPGWLLPWLLLSAFRLIPPPLVSTGLLWVALCSGACAVSAVLPPNPPLLPRFWSQLRPVLSLPFSGRDSSRPAEWGPRPVDAHPAPPCPSMATPCSEGRWGRMWSLRLGQDACPPHPPLASASLLPLPLPNLPASAGQGL